MSATIKQQSNTVDKSIICPIINKDNNIVDMVAPEICMKIFHLAYPRGASTLRLVCKKWRDVYNDNYEIKAKLNDATAELPNFFQYRRVTECTVVSFRREYLDQHCPRLFQDPCVLTKLTILGKVTRQNLLLLGEQCTNVRELIMTGASLEAEAKLFKGETVDAKNVLKIFLGNLRKLVITGAFFHDNNSDPAANGFTSKNLISLLGYEMPNLTTLIVRISSCTFLANEILGFIEKCGALKHVEVDYHISGWFLKKFCIAPRVLVNTLRCLNIKVNGLEDLRYWLPLITVQRRLEELRLRLKCNDGYCDFTEEIFDVIKKNAMLEEIEVDFI